MRGDKGLNMRHATLAQLTPIPLSFPVWVAYCYHHKNNYNSKIDPPSTPLFTSYSMSILLIWLLYNVSVNVQPIYSCGCTLFVFVVHLLYNLDVFIYIHAMYICGCNVYLFLYFLPGSGPDTRLPSQLAF